MAFLVSVGGREGVGSRVGVGVGVGVEGGGLNALTCGSI